jgi:hypothetical protein
MENSAAHFTFHYLLFLLTFSIINVRNVGINYHVEMSGTEALSSSAELSRKALPADYL